MKELDISVLEAVSGGFIIPPAIDPEELQRRRERLKEMAEEKDEELNSAGGATGGW